MTTSTGTSNGSIGLYRTGEGVLQALFTIGIDAGGSDHRYVNITDEPHYLEIRVVRATGGSSNNGYMQCWIDGVEQTAITGVDNYTRFAHTRYVSVGATLKTGSWSGTFYVDEIIVRDDETYIGPVAGGTEYTQSLAGYITTVVGGLDFKAKKILAGGVTPSAALVRLVSVLKIGSLLPSGVLVRRTARALAGAVSIAGALAADLVELAQYAISGVFAPAGTLVKKTRTSFSGYLIPVGSQVMKLRRALAGAVSTAGALAAELVEFIQSAISGAFTPAGTLLKKLKTSFSGNVSPGGGLLKKLKHVLAGSISPVGVRVMRFRRVLAGALQPVGAVLAGVGGTLQVALTGAVALSGSLGRGFKKALAAALAFVGALLSSLLDFSPLAEGVIYGPDGEGTCYKGVTYANASGPDLASVIRGVEG